MFNDMLGNAKSQIRVGQLNSGSGEIRPEMKCSKS